MGMWVAQGCRAVGFAWPNPLPGGNSTACPWQSSYFWGGLGGLWSWDVVAYAALQVGMHRLVWLCIQVSPSGDLSVLGRSCSALHLCFMTQHITFPTWGGQLLQKPWSWVYVVIVP